MSRALPWPRPAPVRAELRVAVPRSRGYWTRSRERLFANHFAMFFGAILLVFSAVAAAAPLLSDDDHPEALGEGSRSYPFLRARTLFSLGRWLRGQRRNARLTCTSTRSDQPVRPRPHRLRR